MKVGAVAENPMERLALALGVAPTPLMDTMTSLLLARAVMVGTRVGVFETLAAGPLAAAEVAARCGTHPVATKKLLDALVGAGYLRLDRERYALAPVARKWLLKDSPRSLRDNVLLRFLEWEVIEQFDEYVRTGRHLDVHATITSTEDWELYQRGMRSLAGGAGEEVVRRTPIPPGARDMLDIGGSHGHYSALLCRKHPGLRSVVLDLPEAVDRAAPMLAEEGMGDRVVHRVGDVLTEDLGTETWDVVFASQVVHHFDDAANRDLARRVARALRPGGVFVIQEAIRPESPQAAGQMGTLMDFYFGLLSNSDTWSFEEIADWQRSAGLVPRRPVRFRRVPGAGQQSAVKPRTR